MLDCAVAAVPGDGYHLDRNFLHLRSRLLYILPLATCILLCLS